MATTIVTKSGSGAPAASDLVAGELAVDLTNKRLYTEDSGGTVLELGTNPSGNVTFADNGKAIFGAGPELQIYSDGTSGIIKDVGSGDIKILADDFYLQNAAGSSTLISVLDTGKVGLGFAGSEKLTTTVTGIDVTGSVTADGLTSSGDVTLGSGASLQIDDQDSLLFGTFVLGSSGTLLQGGTSTAFDTYVGGKKRHTIASNGDISFYEDTGTTAKFFWDASAESLGIGTSSPATALHLSGATGAAPKLTFEEGGAESRIYATKNSPTNSDLRFQTEISGTIADRMVIDYSGSVGIGTSSPKRLMHLNNAAALTTKIQITNLSTGSSTDGDGFQIGISNDGTANIEQRENLDLTFSTNNIERMRIDSSGNLLVGKTALDNSTVGIRMNATGDASFVSDGTRPLVLNRKTSDGDIALFLKDGTTVGSIGNIEDLLYIAADDTTDCGIRFDGDNQEISPCTATGAYSDGNIDLGDGSARFKDLYLAGGAYLGGTAAANKLEDYEEGTWTPVLSKATTAPSVTYTTQAGTYTKVGRMIYVSGLLSWTAISGGTGDFHITNLPFTILNSVGAYPQLVCIDYNGVTFGANDTTFGGYGNPNGTYIVLLASKNNATNSTVISGLAGSGFMYFNLTYQAG
jgi:hypothetical protein